MKTPEPQSFEITEYGDEDDPQRMFSGIAQIGSEMISEMPNCAVRFRQEGDHLKVVYQTYEMFVPRKLANIQEQSRVSIKEAISHLKREFKKRYKKNLKLKEIKGSDNYTTQKVSMNERYAFTSWCVYEMDR